MDAHHPTQFAMCCIWRHRTSACIEVVCRSHSAQNWHHLGSQLGLCQAVQQISPRVAAAAARYMGVSEEVASNILRTFSESRGAWRLPGNAQGALIRHERGIPQGTATSVMMAEIFLSTLIWKIVKCCEADVVTSVDDVNLIACQRSYRTS